MSEEGPSANKRRRVKKLHKIEFNLFRLIPKITTEEAAIEFAQEVGLLPTKGVCPLCHKETSQIRARRRNNAEQRYFQCTEKECKKTKRHEVSVKKGTWFEGSKLPYRKSIVLLYAFALKLNSYQAIVESSLGGEATSSETVTDFFSYCREVCVENFYDKDSIKKIGGINYTVEIDEAKFGKRKYNRGRVVEGQWVLGGICRETKESFLVPVQDRTAETLLSLIEKHVEKGSTIHTDCFKSYDRLEEAGYKHLTVNHSQNFVDPETSACTNTIESTWWAVRRGLPSRGATKKDFGLHLGEYMWRKKTAEEDPFLAFIEAVKKVYSGPGA